MNSTILDRRIEEMGLSVRAFRSFKHAGIDTVQELLLAPDEALEPYFDEVRAGLLRLDREDRGNSNDR